MEKELQITADGSHTLYIPAMDEHYHSVNGALQESRHIFIEAGLHEAEWNTPVSISERFTLHKIEGNSNACELPDDIDLIYFDAFAPEKQPEMWNQEIYNRLYAHTAPGGVIVTYCAKGEVRRGMQAAGFEMSRLPGPPGKRHILRGKN